jgi:hypothetical protein
MTGGPTRMGVTWMSCRIGNYRLIKIDGLLQRDLLFSSLQVAADRAKEMIDQERGTD